MQGDDVDAALKDLPAAGLDSRVRERTARLARAAFMEEVARGRMGWMGRVAGFLVPALLGSAAVVHTASAVAAMVRIFGGG